MNKIQKLSLSLLWMLFLLWLVSAIPLPLSAQSGTPAALQWSLPRRVPGIADDTNPPYLIADRNRTVHAFFSQSIAGNLAVFYSQWSSLTSWTRPVDILLSPIKQRATTLGAFLDSKGIFHVIFYGGIAEGAKIYYSSAPAVNAGLAPAWSPPKMIGDGASAPASGALVGDDNGNLFVVYAGLREGYGIYATLSNDGGATWSDPSPIFLTQSSIQSTFSPQLYLSGRGWLHAIWLVVSSSGQGRGIYYARMNSHDKQWTFPTSLAETPTGLGVRDPAIVEHKGILFAEFYNADMGGHYVMRTSSDDGQSWTPSNAPFPQHIGDNGPGSFVIDSNDNLHLLWGQRIPGSPGISDVHGIWHSLWKADNQWSVPEPIVSGPQTAQFDPSLPSTVVSQGNTLLVTWRQDPGLTGNGVWYSYTTLNAPELPVAAIPTPVMTATATPAPTATLEPVVPTRTTIPRLVSPNQPTGIAPSPLGSNPNLAILIAILPVIILLSVVLVARNLRRAI